MNAVPKQPQALKSQGQRTWTDAQRLEQARKLHERKIWLVSTGPRTADGKLKSSANARKEDYDQRRAERAEMRTIKRYLRTQKSYTDLLKHFVKQEHNLTVARHNAYIDALFFLENELIDIEHEMFGGYRFSEIAGLDNRANVVQFKPPPPSPTAN